VFCGRLAYLELLGAEGDQTGRMARVPGEIIKPFWRNGEMAKYGEIA
jgi:hypothetical protein